MEELLSGLQEYWLSKKAAQVYITVLKLGAAPWATIARQSWLNRVTVYAILTDLIEKWIAAKLKRKWIFFFSVIDPEGLLQVLVKKTKTLEGLLPAFAMIAQSIGEKPQIQYLEWEEGYKKMFVDFMTMTDGIRAFIWSYTRQWKFINVVGQEFKEWRIANNFSTKQLIVDEEYARNRWNKSTLIDSVMYSIPEEYKEMIVIKNFPSNFEADINIYWPHKVAIAFFDDNNYPHVVLIKSKQLYEFMVWIFEYIWQSEIEKWKKAPW